MKDFCQQQLSYGYRDVNKQIERLLSAEQHDVSPLLKFYNELYHNSNFRLPAKSLLEFDHKIFMKHLAKIKKAHQIEMRWVQKAARDKAKEILRADYEKTRKILTAEVIHLME